MILVFHKNNKIVQIYDYNKNCELKILGKSIQETLILIAAKNNAQFIGWCHIALKNQVNIKKWEEIFKHPLIMASYGISNSFYMDSRIGYVEEAPFINVNKAISYPTWLMSSNIGALHASVLLKFKDLLLYKIDFDFFLNTIAKIGMKQGLLCYSNPKLLKENSSEYLFKNSPITTLNLLWFIKSNYRFRWVFLFILNTFIYKKKIYLLKFIAILFKRKIDVNVSFEKLPNNPLDKKYTVDVIIPTLGREKYLHNVLIDLANQTLVPNKVIIIEQNPIKGEGSKLDFLDRSWPFIIDHTLIHQLGVCNARNIALTKITADWVFFADDDIRFKATFLKDAFQFINSYKINAINISCLQKNEIEKRKFITQSTTFGSGTSIVKSKSLEKIKFDMAYEFGYGEDTDFGMQLRNNGTDILYLPFVSMLHLKAPIGGFRKKIIKAWEKDAILPKPSPTVMVYKLTHATKEQLQSYKTTLFLKFYRSQKQKNPFLYLKKMKKSWEKSIFLANQLININSNEI